MQAAKKTKNSPIEPTVDTQDEYLLVGNLGKSYGLQGWLKVNSFTEPMENILQYDNWCWKVDGQWLPMPLDNRKQHGAMVIAKIKGYDSPESARLFTNREIGILRSQLPSLQSDEYYWDDLHGLDVKTLDEQSLGTVIAIMETGANDVMVVKGDRERLIPFVLDEYVKKVDLQNKSLIVDWDPEF